MTTGFNMQTVFPLTPMQQGMLFHHLREPDSAAYFQQLRVSLSGQLDIALLKKAWKQVLSHHPAMQMRFVWNADVPRQIHDVNHPLPFSLIDYRQYPVNEHALLREKFLQDDQQQGFSLETAPLMRVTLLRWSEQDWDFIWSHHHLILDGWSSGLVLAELTKIYAALLKRADVHLATPRPFTDFLQWLGKRDNLAAEDYWRHALRDYEPLNTTAIIRRNTKTTIAKVESLQCVLDSQHNAALTSLMQELGVTAVVPVFACWGLLLAKYTDADDVLFGITTSGRPDELSGVESMVGLLINTLPLRMNAVRAGGATIAQCLSDIHRRLAASREHEHTALSRITEWTGFPANQPLFDSIIVYENYPPAVEGDMLGEARITGFHLQEESNYPLTLIVEPQAGSLHLRLLVDTSRVAPETAKAMLEQYLYLLQQLSQASPDQQFAQLHLLTPEQQHRQLQQWNDTARAYDTSATLASIFIAQAGRTPDAIALVDARGTLTYADLQNRVSQVSNALTDFALAPASPVAIRLTRDREMVIALLAVVAAGHHYVPIEPQLPADRVMAIFDSLPVSCMLTVSTLAKSTRALADQRNIRTLNVDETTDRPIRPLQNHASSQAPAYVIFTSGSTGKPKGVLVLHQKAINLITWVNNTFQVGEDDKILFLTSPAFDLSVYDIFGVLAAGATVRIASEAETADPESLLDIIANEGITFWDSAPAALWQLESLLPRLASQTGARASKPATLRLVFLSGDWIPLALPDKLKAAFPGVCVVALGGATEATIWSNYHIVADVQPDWVSIPYGRPIQNARYYILDSDLQAVPIGVPGDLYIGGDCLAEGYVGQVGLTAERFIDDPHAADGAIGARMYKTGDRARFYPDGVMEFLGRLDNQVKIRGFRIELGDIEIAMGRHPAVRDAICIVHDHSNAGPASGQSEKELLAYFVCHPGQSLDAEELRRHLSQLLPVNMIPAFIMPLASLPVSVNGKVDRKNLPLPDRQQAGRHTARADTVQEIIAAAWCEVLGCESVSIDDDFFAIGGHSLRATSVMARLRAAFATELPLRLIFDYPVLVELASAIRGLASGRTAGSEGVLPLLDRSQGLPLSRAQSRLWFLHQMEKDSANYNVALAARLDGRLDLELFRQAAQQVVARHEIFNLRVCLQTDSASLKPVAVGTELVFQVQDFSTQPVDETEINTRLKHLASLPFDLEQQRPLRLAVLRNSEQQAHVLIVIHHIATDGWAIALFAQELLQAYDDVVNKLPSVMPAAPALQYADFSAWWEQQVAEKSLPVEMAYWKHQLANLPRLHISSDFTRPAVTKHAGARFSFSLDEKLSEDLRRVARQNSVTLFMLLLTAFEVVLRRRSGRDDIVIGTDIAGRDHPLAEKIQGFFVNQLVLRTDFSACHHFSEMLTRVRHTSLQAFFHQHLPFDALVQELNPGRDTGGMPLFQHKFVLQNAPLASLETAHFQIHPVDLHTDTAKYDLLLTVIDEARLRATLEYSTELFTSSNAESMTREFSAVLTQIATDTSITYASLKAMLDLDGEARSEAAKKDLRKSGLQRLKELRKPGASIT